MVKITFQTNEKNIGFDIGTNDTHFKNLQISPCTKIDFIKAVTISFINLLFTMFKIKTLPESPIHLLFLCDCFREGESGGW